MYVIQDEVFIISAFYKFGVHTINIKDLISKSESTKQDRVSKNQNNLMVNINQYNIFRWDGYLLYFSLGHQSYTDWEIK